jgi:hypothetical protein
MQKHSESHESSSDLRIFLSAIFHIVSIVCVPFLAYGTVKGNVYALGLLLFVAIYYSIRLFVYRKVLGLGFLVASLCSIVWGIYHFGLILEYKNAQMYLGEEQKFCSESTYDTLKLKHDAENSKITASFRTCLDRQQVSSEVCREKMTHETSLNEVIFSNRLLRLSNCSNSLITKEKNLERVKSRSWVKFWLGLFSIR